MKNIVFEKKIIIFILIAGVLLSLLQFIYNRSLWTDEAFLSVNIINKNHFDLLKPLDLLQVAPILFLQIEKIFSELIPNSEYGLRLFPLICYLFSLFLIYKIINSIHQNNYTIIFSLSIFVFNATLIYYSSEVKQYMTDVLVITSIYYFILKNYRNEKHKYYCLGIVGVISIFLSNIACIILFTAGLYLLFDIYHNKKKYFLHLIVISVLWASTFLLYYFLFIFNHPSLLEQKANFSLYSNAFMPTNPFNIQFFKFFLTIGPTITCGLFRFTIIGGIILSILIVIGIISLIRKRKVEILILTITPFIVHLLLSSLELYPVQKRLILYISPCIIIICSFGFDYIVTILFSYLKIERAKLLAISIPLLMFILMSVYVFQKGFPMGRHSEIKECIDFIEQNMNKKDKVYVLNWDATGPFQYYKLISYIKLDTNNIVLKGDFCSDSINCYKELNKLSGRIWFLFGPDKDGDKKISFLINYFNSKGNNIKQEFHTTGSDVYLYNIENHKE